MGHIESTRVAINPNALVIGIDVNGLNIRAKRPQLSYVMRKSAIYKRQSY